MCKTTVYVLTDNSTRSSELWGIFSSREKAQEWLDNMYASGLIMSHEYNSATIDKWIVE